MLSKANLNTETQDRSSSRRACWGWPDSMSARQLVAPHPSLPPWHPGETKPGVNWREQQSPAKAPRWPVGQEHRKGHLPFSLGAEPHPGRGTSTPARTDLRNGLWNGALFTYPSRGASKTGTCKSDNNQEKASCRWFVKRRPWAAVLSAIHRSLKSGGCACNYTTGNLGHFIWTVGSYWAVTATQRQIASF